MKSGFFALFNPARQLIQYTYQWKYGHSQFFSVFLNKLPPQLLLPRLPHGIYGHPHDYCKSILLSELPLSF